MRGVNTEDALSLAKAHGRHLWVMRILLEDMKKYQDAITYMAGLEFRDVSTLCWIIYSRSVDSIGFLI